MLAELVSYFLVSGRQTRAEQIIGREAKTATFLSRCLFPFNLSVIGFCPRQLSR
jgi:hypothetical protein